MTLILDMDGYVALPPAERLEVDDWLERVGLKERRLVSIVLADESGTVLACQALDPDAFAHKDCDRGPGCSCLVPVIDVEAVVGEPFPAALLPRLRSAP